MTNILDPWAVGKTPLRLTLPCWGDTQTTPGRLVDTEGMKVRPPTHWWWKEFPTHSLPLEH